MDSDWTDNHTTGRDLANNGGTFDTSNKKLGSACGSFLTLDRASYSDNLGASVTAFTLAAWADQNSVAANKCFIGWTGTGDLPSIYTDATGVVVRVGDATEYGRVTFAGTTSWFHAVMVYDGSGAADADRLKLYINGVDQSLTYNATIPSSITGTGTFRISGGAGNMWWDGLVDEAAVWERAITPAEVDDLYNGGDGSVYPYPSVGALPDGRVSVKRSMLWRLP